MTSVPDYIFWKCNNLHNISLNLSTASAAGTGSRIADGCFWRYSVQDDSDVTLIVVRSRAGAAPVALLSISSALSLAPACGDAMSDAASRVRFDDKVSYAMLCVFFCDPARLAVGRLWS